MYCFCILHAQTASIFIPLLQNEEYVSLLILCWFGFRKPKTWHRFQRQISKFKGIRLGRICMCFMVYLFINVLILCKIDVIGPVLLQLSSTSSFHRSSHYNITNRYGEWWQSNFIIGRIPPHKVWGWVALNYWWGLVLCGLLGGNPGSQTCLRCAITKRPFLFFGVFLFRVYFQHL